MEYKYNGNFARLRDVSRMALQFQSADNLLNSIAKLQEVITVIQVLALFQLFIKIKSFDCALHIPLHIKNNVCVYNCQKSTKTQTERQKMNFVQFIINMIGRKSLPKPYTSWMARCQHACSS